MTAPMEWADRGACRGVDQDVFFPDFSLRPKTDGQFETWDIAARRVDRRYCSTCPVRVQCHDHALWNEPDGIWAGLPPYRFAQLRAALGVTLADTPDPTVVGVSRRHVTRIRNGHTPDRPHRITGALA